MARLKALTIQMLCYTSTVTLAYTMLVFSLSLRLARMMWELLMMLTLARVLEMSPPSLITLTQMLGRMVGPMKELHWRTNRILPT